MTAEELDQFCKDNGFTFTHTPGELYTQQIADPGYIFRRSWSPGADADICAFNEHKRQIELYLTSPEFFLERSKSTLNNAI